MDWANERYVRVYTRDTDDWICLPWQARALWHELLRKADRAGVIQTRRGAVGLAALTRIPIDVVEAALPVLLADGCVQENKDGFVLPNYIVAQETPQSDAQRQREARERRRAAAVTERDVKVTERDAPVTNREEMSRATVHAEQNVTPSLPSLTTPDQPRAGASELPRSPEGGRTGRMDFEEDSRRLYRELQLGRDPLWPRPTMNRDPIGEALDALGKSELGRRLRLFHTMPDDDIKRLLGRPAPPLVRDEKLFLDRLGLWVPRSTAAPTDNLTEYRVPRRA